MSLENLMSSLPKIHRSLSEPILNRYYTVSFSKDVFSQGAEYQVFLGVFLMFLAFFHSKIWAKFHFGTFESYKKEKS